MHTVLFAGLAIILVIAFRFPLNRRTMASVLGMVLAVGPLQEGFQALSAGHVAIGPAVFDLGVDLTGGMIGFLAVLGVQILFDICT
jgi:hypothetical protein